MFKASSKGSRSLETSLSENNTGNEETRQECQRGAKWDRNEAAGLYLYTINLYKLKIKRASYFNRTVKRKNRHHLSYVI